MSTIQTLLANAPQFEFSSQYAPVDEVMNSIVCFVNYYDQVFRESNIDLSLHIIFFDRQGNEMAYKVIDIAANDAIQFDPKADGIRNDGMVAVAAIPKRNIHDINNGRLQIRAKIGSGFYIKWEKEAGGKDLMHEWAALQTQPLPSETHHVGLSKAHAAIEHGIILMNPVTKPGAFSHPILRLRISGCQDVIESVILPPIPPLGTSVVYFSSIFKAFDSLLNSEKALVIDAIAENLSPPLTAEWNTSGDFHFHHI